MGVRANFVVVDEQGMELYYDHWGAEGMSWDLVLDGAEATLTRVLQMRRHDRSNAQEWLDDIWGEGMLALDLSRQRLFWFDSAGMYPRLAAYLIERTWDGWKAVWSPEGMRGILRVLGIDPRPILGDGVGARSLAKRELRHLDTHINAGYVSSLTILSVRFEGGRVWPVTVGTRLDTLSGLRWNWVMDYVRRARAAGRRGAGKDGAWFVEYDHPLPPWLAYGPQDDWAHYGVHVDVTARRLWWWSNRRPEAGLLQPFARNWPGFEIITLGDDYEWQERAAGISGIQPPLSDILRWQREALTQADGHPVPAARVSGRQQAFAELDALIAAGPGRLPRVRYVDASGRIVQPGDEP